ncbi:MAG TPA: glycerol kinase GlpK [Bacteriovoracaceae bacterium]|nr:glycerol kinase GlpK [Bacteriovoracaceae bacterium]
MGFLLAIDQGTTGTTSLILDSKTLKILDKEKQDYTQIYPKPGLVEHNLEEIWTSVTQSVTAVIKRQGIDPKKIEAIGITNQRETTCAYSKSGKPLHNAIVWQDRRTAEYCEKNTTRYQEVCRKKTGLPLDPYFSGSKMRWFLDNVPAVKAAADKKDLCLTTVDSFLLHRLSSGKIFATEVSNASRTMLMNLQTFDWDSSLLEFFGISREYLPEIKESFTDFGKTNGCGFLPDGIPILSILGDQQAALFGQACVKVGDIKCTYGTGAFLLLNTGDKIIHSQTGLLTTAAHSFRGKKAYALEGSAYIAGAAVQWLRDNLKCIKAAPEVEELARQVTDLSQMEHVLFLPFFTGIGTPYWNSHAKAALVGLTRDTHNGHIARACLEGIALSVNDSVASFKKDFAHLNDIRVDGGAAANGLLMQLQSNFSQKKILRPACIDTTAFGVAVGCLVAKGEVDITDMDKYWKLEKEFSPESEPYYAKKRTLWTGTIERMFT